MEYDITAPEFAKRRVTVETKGVFGGTPRLLVDGRPVDKQADGTYAVTLADRETPVVVRLKSSGMDPVPVAEVNGRTVRLAPPLAWYEYVWACVPVLLLVIGGAIGGLLGATAAYLNLGLLRSSRGAGARYGLSAAVTVAAFAAYFTLASLLHSTLHHR